MKGIADTFNRVLDDAYLVTTPNKAFIGRLVGWTSKGRGIFQSESGGRTIEVAPGDCQERCGKFVKTFYKGRWEFRPDEYPPLPKEKR